MFEKSLNQDLSCFNIEGVTCWLFPYWL